MGKSNRFIKRFGWMQYRNFPKSMKMEERWAANKNWKRSPRRKRKKWLRSSSLRLFFHGRTLKVSRYKGISVGISTWFDTGSHVIPSKRRIYPWKRWLTMEHHWKKMQEKFRFLTFFNHFPFFNHNFSRIKPSTDPEYCPLCQFSHKQ